MGLKCLGCGLFERLFFFFLVGGEGKGRGGYYLLGMKKKKKKWGSRRIRGDLPSHPSCQQAVGKGAGAERTSHRQFARCQKGLSRLSSFRI